MAINWGEDASKMEVVLENSLRIGEDILRLSE